MPVPSLDEQIGLLCYATSGPGVGGEIRASPDDFRVREIITPAVWQQLRSATSPRTPYALAALEKRGIDTPHALEGLARHHGLQPRVLGLKDAKAATLQYASLTRRQVRDRALWQVGDYVTLRVLGFLPEPLRREHLVGNEFVIAIRGLQVEHRDITRAIDEVRRTAFERRMPNFYGHQRFGSSRPVSHLIGRAIIQRQFREALRYLLCTPGLEDDPQTIEARQLAAEERFGEASRCLPPRHDFEHRVLRSLVDRPTDAVGALRQLPLRLRRLYVHAYQAFLWNRAMSTLLVDDAARDEKSFPVQAEVEPATGRILRMRRQDIPGSNKIMLAPLVGYAYRDYDSAVDAVLRRLLKEEGVTARHFFVPELGEVSAEGGYRQAFMWVLYYTAETETHVIQLRCALPKGSYVTILLRELMKPADPYRAGF